MRYHQLFELHEWVGRASLLSAQQHVIFTLLTCQLGSLMCGSVCACMCDWLTLAVFACLSLGSTCFCSELDLCEWNFQFPENLCSDWTIFYSKGRCGPGNTLVAVKGFGVKNCWHLNRFFLILDTMSLLCQMVWIPFFFLFIISGHWCILWEAFNLCLSSLSFSI